MTLETQYMTLLVMSLNGAVLGALYDMYRVVLRHWKFLRWAGPLFDFSFWILAFFLVFWSLMWANDGDLRIYVFVVLGIGLFLYRILLQRIVVGSTIGIIMGIRYLCLAVFNIFVLVVVQPLIQLWKLLLGVLRLLDRLLRVAETLILWPFKPLFWLLIRLYKLVAGLLKFLLRPVYRLLDPYLAPIRKRIRPVKRYASIRIKKLFQKGKGIAVNLANWLMNRDDHK